MGAPHRPPVLPAAPAPGTRPGPGSRSRRPCPGSGPPFGRGAGRARRLPRDRAAAHPRPLASGGILGDALAQTTTGLPFDVARNLRLAAFGLVFGGPAGHAWHRALDARILPRAPTSLAAVAAKLAADQLLFAPVATALLFAFLKVAEGDPAAALPFVAANWWRTLKANWCLWPAANLVAFAAIPADLRILYANAVGVLWCCYVSIACNGPASLPPPPPLDHLE